MTEIAIQPEREGLPISDDAFFIALQALDIYFWKQNFDPSNSLLYKASDLIKEIANPSQRMTHATYTTLWNISVFVDPGFMEDEFYEDASKQLFSVKERCSTVESLKKTVEQWMEESKFNDSMSTEWDIGDGDSDFYTDAESLLKEVQWESIVKIVELAWDYSLSEEAMKDLRAYKEDCE